MSDSKLLSTEEVYVVRIDGLDIDQIRAIEQFFINITGCQPSDLTPGQIRGKITYHTQGLRNDHQR